MGFVVLSLLRAVNLRRRLSVSLILTRCRHMCGAGLGLAPAGVGLAPTGLGFAPTGRLLLGELDPEGSGVLAPHVPS